MTLDQKIMHQEVKDYIFITFGILLYTFGWTVFLLPYEIVTGGVTGASAIIYYATGFRIENTYMIINLALLAVALKILGFRFLMKSIYAIFALYFALKVGQDLMPIDPQTGEFWQILGPGQDFMSLVIGCSITGSALGVVFLNNGSTGGTDIIAACVNKYKDISLGQVLFLVDVVIVGSCFFFPQFGAPLERAHKVVFGFCTMIIENFMLDYVYNRNRESVQFLIFSKESESIANALTKYTDHSLTILDGHGWYSKKEMKVICLLARKRESPTIFRLIKDIDPNAFVSQSSVIGVFGEGFDKIKVKVKKKKKDENSVRNEQPAQAIGNS